MPDQVERVTEQQSTDEAGRTVRTRTVSADTQERKVNKVNQIVWFIFGVFIILPLALRVLLALMGANTANAFANFIYSWTAPLVGPFRGLLSVGEFQAGVARFEFETLIAIIIYALLAWVITAGINLVKKNPEV